MIGTMLPSSNRLTRKLFSRFVSARCRPSLDGGIIARLCFDPRLTARALDLLPERGVRFQIVHEKFGCRKRRLAVGRRSHDKYDFFARRDPPIAVNNGDAQQPPPVRGFGYVTLDLGFRHARIMLECQRCDRFAILDAPANSRKCDDSSHITLPVRKRCRFRSGVKGLALQSDGRFHALNLARRSGRGYPPVMGGKNAISPAFLIAASDRTWR